TSQLCPTCHARCETFKWRENPRPWRKGKMRKVHGLLRYTNEQCLQTTHPSAVAQRHCQRDLLATLNMLDIASSMVAGVGVRSDSAEGFTNTSGLLARSHEALRSFGDG